MMMMMMYNNTPNNHNNNRHRSLWCCWLSLLMIVVAVHGQQQQQQASNNNNRLFVHKTIIIPHDSKKHRGGEDAAATSDTTLVVADGVGGWARQNVNPGLYSKLLTDTVLELADAETTVNSTKSKRSLVDIVHEANWIAAKQHLGSATCTVVTLGSDGTSLETLNVGDSGYSIHRYGNDDAQQEQEPQLSVVYASTPGQKSFNFPYQLGGKYGDQVKDVAVEATHELQPNDIIVVYSDGVSDNLDPEQFHGCLVEGSDSVSKKITSLSWIADCIAKSAYVLGKDRTFLSPFAKGARESGRGNYIGGKHDDITVTVAQVVSVEEAVEARFVNDPYLSESIFLYTGEIETIPEAPKLIEKTNEEEEVPSLVGEEL